jgi:hypothetical protein
MKPDVALPDGVDRCGKLKSKFFDVPRPLTLTPFTCCRNMLIVSSNKIMMDEAMTIPFFIDYF